MLVSPNVESSLRMSPIFAAGELSASIRSAMRGGLSIIGRLRSSSRGEAPGKGLARAQRLQLGLAKRQHLGQRPGDLVRGALRRVGRQAVEGRTGEARKLLEPLERAGRLERLGVQLERAERGIAAGAAARVLLQRGSVR